MPYETFTEWLAAVALAAGYDTTPGRGGRADLAKKMGVDASVVGKALAGGVTPNIGTLRLLAQALDVPIAEMLVRSGTLKPEDLPQSGEAPPPPVTELDLRAVARHFGVPADRTQLFVASVEAVAKTFADEAEGDTVGRSSQTGGLSAKR
jgi:transcriptional regulator with XRE-family HTH domain